MFVSIPHWASQETVVCPSFGEPVEHHEIVTSYRFGNKVRKLQYMPAWAGYWLRNNTNYNTKITLPAEIHWGLMHNMAPIGKTGLGMLIPPEISLFHLSNYPLKGFKRLVFALGKLNKETTELKNFILTHNREAERDPHWNRCVRMWIYNII